MIHCLRTIDYCFWFSFLTTYLCKFSSKKFFLHFLDNDDRMSSKRRNLSALVFLINVFENIKFLMSDSRQRYILSCTSASPR